MKGGHVYGTEPDRYNVFKFYRKLNITTPHETLYPFIEQLDFVQFMGIAEIGFQGSTFSESVFAKIEDLRNRYPELIISVDGGVNLEVAKRLVETGVNRIVVGSAIFGKNDREKVERALTEFQSTFS